MQDNEKIFLGIAAVLMVVVCVFAGLRMFKPSHPVDIKPPEPSVEEELPVSEKQPKVYVNVFFIGQNENKEEVYKAVKREYDEKADGSKVKFAMNSLVNGPKPAEKSKGVYSEIPPATRVIAVTEQPDKVIINLNSSFETGGGTDSIYKRIYQIIKTAKRNTSKPVYLYIEGKKADVIGGEGIMLNQPLSNSSLDE
ncbi:MAG: GerMN domain-containing protein [Heliobacteriaceae bacterium]|jgi:spore germination protein GerM|nr:GerMN domain-containing protein [Heliobacteriaceae bacterium]